MCHVDQNIKLGKSSHTKTSVVALSLGMNGHPQGQVDGEDGDGADLCCRVQAQVHPAASLVAVYDQKSAVEAVNK